MSDVPILIPGWIVSIFLLCIFAGMGFVCYQAEKAIDAWADVFCDLFNYRRK